MKIRFAYVIAGIVTGLILVFQFITAIPDGQLHMTVCDVGQGDAIYFRLPDGRTMLVDGGPNDRVLTCLGQLKPMFDRTIDIVVLTHPDSDHLTGIVSVLQRYRVGYLVRSDVSADGTTYATFANLVSNKHVQQKFVTAGDVIDVGGVHIRILWPSKGEVALLREQWQEQETARREMAVLGAATTAKAENNPGCVVFQISYGKFDAVLTGDAGEDVEPMEDIPKPKDGIVEVLKVPHHGSKTGLTDEFLRTMGRGTKADNQYALISVGKNNFGQPAAETLNRLKQAGFTVRRTDTEGALTIVSDGERFTVSGEKTR